MTFPSVINTATTTATSGTSLVLNMPASIVAGRLLLALAGTINDDTATAAISGWTPLGSLNNLTSASLSVFGKVAAGGDTATLTGISGTSRPAVIVAQIDGFSGSLAGIGVALAAPSTVDPPSLTMPTSDDYLWIAVARAGIASSPTAPSSYGGLVSVANGSSTVVGMATRAFTNTNQDPGVFGGTWASRMVTATIAIPPVSAPANTGARFMAFFA